MKENESKTKIRIFQGNQIGGCVVSIETTKTKICIDFGENLPGNDNKERIEIEGLTKPAKVKYDALFFTHYHSDHIGRIKDVLSGVKMYMGETTKQVLLTINSTIENTKMCEILKNKEAVKTFKENQTIKVGDIKITPYSIDHSAYDAYMFLIETPDKVILHTGDFRLHGYRGYKTLSLIKSYIKDFGKRKIDILITEGTMLSRKNEKYYTEKMMLDDAIQLMAKHKYVFLICTSTNLDSLATFYQAGQKQFPRIYMYANNYVIEQLNNFSKTAGKRTSLYNFKNIRTVNFNKEITLKDGSKTTQEEMMKRYGFVTIIKANKAYEKWIERFKDCEEKPVVIYSMWDGYLKKENKSYDKELASFYNKYNAISMHTSGHIYPKDLEKVINTVNPTEAIIPIHTENAEEIKNLKLKYYLKKKIKLNIDEYIGKKYVIEDSRKVSEEMLNELKNGRFSEFVKFVKNNSKNKLNLCFRGNINDSVIIYYNNHKVWELIKEDDDLYVKISFNHARYTKNWKKNLKLLCDKYNFTDENYKKIDIDNAVKKIKNKKSENSYQYSIGYLVSKNGVYDKDFVEGTFKILFPMIKDFFDKEKNIDYFKSSYEKRKIVNNRKKEYLEKKVQQDLYFELDNSEEGLYVYDMEFAQKTLPGHIKTKNQADMHAIRFKNGKPECFVMIEVKSTKSAMNDKKSGLKKHLEGMEQLKDNKEFINNRLQEAYEIIAQYQKLGLREIKKFDFKNDIKLYKSISKVEILFILTDGASKYYYRNKNYYSENNLKRIETYLTGEDKKYKIKDNEENRIEIYKEFKI